MTNTETKATEAGLVEVVPMVKEATVKDDGRFLFYYSFKDNKSTDAAKDDQEASKV